MSNVCKGIRHESPLQMALILQSMMRARTVPTGFIPPWLPTKHPLPSSK